MTGHDSMWWDLRDKVEMINSDPQPYPLSNSDWQLFEEQIGMAFPDDYKEYCRCFGPGDWSRAFHIAVPMLGKTRGQYNLFRHNEWMHPENPDIDMIGEERLPLFHRAVHFASDVVGNSYFWDPFRVKESDQYDVFVWRYTMEVEPVAKGFFDFVTEVCLGSRGVDLISDFRPEYVFAAWKPSSR